MPPHLRTCLIILLAVILMVLVSGCTTGNSIGGETPAQTIPTPEPIPTVPSLPTPEPIQTVPSLPTPEPLPTIPSLTTVADPTMSCTTDSDCVPAECCHPTTCMNVAYKHVCNLMCTAVCQGPLDCGAGHCGCNNGRCGVSPGPSP